MRAFGYIVAGIAAGILCGYLAMFFAMYVVAPMMGNTDEMSSGLIGLFTAVFAIPILAIIGGIVGYRVSKRGRKPVE